MPETDPAEAQTPMLDGQPRPARRPRVRIEVTRRAIVRGVRTVDGFEARLASDYTRWDVGVTSAEAIGNLVLSHPGECGIDLSIRDIRRHPITAEACCGGVP
jgi:hypothetical protein